MTLPAAFGTPRNLHAFMKFSAELLFYICCMLADVGAVKPRLHVCLGTYRNEAVSVFMFVLRLFYFLLELY